MAQRARPSRSKLAALAAVLALATSSLAACSSVSENELIWYTNPDTGGQADLAAKCSKGKDYTIKTQVLPQDATQQRVQLIRRLAAGDPGIDLMSLDPPFTAEFANAGYLADIPEDLATQLEEQSFEGAVKAATWEDKLVVAPFWSNTQVLWYRKSFAEKVGATKALEDGPVTWQQLIDWASQGSGQIGVQANKYEGYSVWINALVESAGGHLVEDPEAGADAKVTIDTDAGKAAAEVISKLASSKAAPSDLSVSNEGTAGATFGGDAGSFLVNWTYIYNNYEAGDPGFNKDIGYTMYPAVEGHEDDAAPPYGGIGIGVNDASEKKDWAFEAIECITNAESQGEYAISSGNMPASEGGYDEVAASEDNPYPEDLLELFQESLKVAAPRTVSPYWSDISGSLLATWHPPSGVDQNTPAESQKATEDILQGKGFQ